MLSNLSNKKKPNTNQLSTARKGLFINKKTNTRKNSLLNNSNSHRPINKSNSHQPKYIYICDTNLGAGSFGIVVGCSKSQAATLGLDSDASSNMIAIKILDTTKINPVKLEREIERFKTEQRIHGLLGDHPNIVKYISDIDKTNIIFQLPILKVNPAETMHFFAIEYCNRGSLGSYLLSMSGQPVDRFNIIYQCFAGLQYLYSQRVLHLDIKPHNILVHQQLDEKGPLIFKISDFGLAKHINTSSPKATIQFSDLICGTMEYIPYFAEKSTFFRDLYAFYCLIYYITTYHHLNAGRPITKRAGHNIMSTLEINPRLLVSSKEFAYLNPIIIILAGLQTEIKQTKSSQQLTNKLTIPALPAPASISNKSKNNNRYISHSPIKESGIAKLNSSSSTAETVQPSRKHLILVRYNLYKSYYSKLDKEFEKIKTETNPGASIIVAEKQKSATKNIPASGNTLLSGTKTIANSVLAEPPLTPVKKND